jgi:metallo-beta-lactamase family protein
MVDCGLFQGPPELRALNWSQPSFDVSSLEHVVLTHAHLDHAGYLPRIYKLGFRGEVWCSMGTRDLCGVLLRDAAKLQEEDAEYANQTKHSKHNPALPLFDTKDVEGVLKLFKSKILHEWIRLTSDVSVRFSRAGHITGATLLEFSIADNDHIHRLCFSGDLGHDRSLTMRPPEPLIEADALVLESTYGDRLHPKGDPLKTFAEIVNNTMHRRGVLIIPSFAIGRAQEILMGIKRLEDASQIPKVSVLLDSPMATAATEIFLAHLDESKLATPFDRSQLFPSNFQMALTPDESMVACMKSGPMIVIAPAGMLSGGRVLHHLKARIASELNTVLFVGYQAEGSKGQYLQKVKPGTGQTLRLFHQEYEVNADIKTLPHFSAHADAEDIIDWLAKFQRVPKQIILNHGDPKAGEVLAGRIRERFSDVQKVEVLTKPASIKLFRN